MSVPRLHFDKGTLLLDGVDASEAPTSFVFDPRVQSLRAPGYVYREALTALHRSPCEYVDEAKAYSTLSLEHHARQTPFPHQAEALDAWERGGRRGVVVLPTGSGKTYVAELAILSAQRSTLVVVPTVDLMSQWYDRLVTAFGTEVGMVGGGYHEVHDLTVTTYDSAYLYLEKLGNRFGLVVFDEVHHLPGPSFSQAAEGSIAPFRLGLTATPERSDEGHFDLEHLVGPIVYRKEIGDLKGDVLSEYRVETIEVDLEDDEREQYDEARAIYRGFLDEKGIWLGRPDGWRRFLAATSRSAEGRRALHAYHEQKAIALAPRSKMRVLESILRKHAGERALIFTNDNATVYRISRGLLIPAITHQTELKERRYNLGQFREGGYPALVTSRVLNEGVDVPAASVGIVLSGSGSVREHVQRLGRILRRMEGKQATLYEVITSDTSEAGTSRRRRSHSAYQ